MSNRIFGEPEEITPEFIEIFKDLWTCGGLLPPELDLGLPHIDYAYNDVKFFMEEFTGVQFPLPEKVQAESPEPVA